jgi:hypothetical protein
MTLRLLCCNASGADKAILIMLVECGAESDIVRSFTIRAESIPLI